MNERVWPPSSRLPVVLAAALIVLAFWFAVRATQGLEWPVESDFYRDMGAAQSMLDGNYPSDPLYLGEISWYNPLLPGIVALITAGTGLPLRVVYVQAGPYLNLLGPVFLFILASLLVGRWAALFALAAYLFGFPDQPTWNHATYSPWLWPFNFTQGLFYASLAAYLVSLRSPKRVWSLVTGLLLGITFLSHTAPALIGALTLLVHSIVSAASGRPEDRARTIERLLTIGVLSFLVSLPFLYAIYERYHFKIINRVPAGYVAVGGTYVVEQLLSFVSLVALVGVLVGYRRYRAEERSENLRLLFILAAVITLLLVHGIATQTLWKRFGLALPQLVPAFHFHLYFRAAQDLFFGIGMVALIDAATRWYVERYRGAAEPDTVRAGLRRVAVPLALVALVAVRLPSYASSRDVMEWRSESQRLALEHGRNALYMWILENTSPNDVFLASHDVGLFAVGAAGRKVVALHSVHSNPYVSYEQRTSDRDEMFEDLRAGDLGAFSALASKYRVTYLAVDEAEKEPCCRLAPDEAGRFREVFRSGTIRLYELAPARPSAKANISFNT